MIDPIHGNQNSFIPSHRINGQAIRIFREHAELSVKDLAEKFNVKAETIRTNKDPRGKTTGY